MAEENKNYILTLVGPDTIEGRGPTERPDYALPEPGPDTEYFYEERQAPGYKLGSYLNVYNFDAIINEILECDDWSECLYAIKKEYFNGSCIVSEVVGYENFLSIDRPELNNIPKNVMVLLESGMVKGTYEPRTPDEDNRHYHYDELPATEAMRRGWWISDELKEILEEVYNWKFFEDVVLGRNMPVDPFAQIRNDVWDGGVKKNLDDVEYHDLKLALSKNIILPSGVDETTDGRADKETFNILALFSYVNSDEAFIEVSAQAFLGGDCELGFQTNVSWSAITPFNPEIKVMEYYLYSKNDPDAEIELLATLPNEEQEVFSFVHDLSGVPTGVPEYPKYYVSWKSNTSGISTEFDVVNQPITFNEYGVPSCEGGNISLSIASVGECWTDEYGEISLTWNISLPPDSEVSELTLVKTRGTETVQYELETDVRNLTDSGNVYDAGEQVEYKIIAVVNSLALDEPVKTIESYTVAHEVEDCICDDVPDVCADKCWIRKESDVDCETESETVFNPELLVWMENYSEDPFSENPRASFDIKYCISNKCAEGLTAFDLSLTLPEGFSIVETQSEHGDPVAESVFTGGLDWGLWKITSDSSWSRAKPTHGTLCRVFIDKPLGNKRIEFLEENTRFTISEGLDDFVYEWTNNALNSSADSKDWQSGPPLSICTDEIDIGYGDYLLDLQAIDLKTFDVNFCLSRDDFDTFIFVVINTDFKTEIDQVDPIVGMAANNGWNISFRNISPGISVIMGNGTKAIRSSGYDTLLRVGLSEASIKREIDSCVCVFPFFLKLGDLWQMVQGLSSNFDANSPNNATSYGTNASYMATPQTYALAASPVSMAYLTASNPVVSGLQNIANNIDPRFKEIVCCIKDAYELFLQRANSPSSGVTQEEIYKVTYSTQLFVMMITVFSSLSIAKGEEINKKLDKIAELGESLCGNYLFLEADGSDGDYEISIKYKFPSSQVAGVQFEVNIPNDFVIVRDGLQGDARNNKFLQVLGNNGTYLAVYDYGLTRKPSVGAAYLTSSPDADPSLLTKFKLQYTGSGTPPSLSQLQSTLGIVVGSDTEIANAKLVTNTNRTDPSRKWNGDWYNVDQENQVNVRDFLVALILCSGGSGDLGIPDDVIVLPTGESVTTKYFGGTSYDLSNITYNPETFIGRDDENFQEYVLDYFDANGDGVADITDVVAIRNLFASLGKSIVSREEASSIRNIVPTELCTVSNGIDLEFYIPDECSDFCVKPRCFSKVWISDIVESETNLLLEISYATECDDASISGAQFKISGLIGEGIIGCVASEPDAPDQFSQKRWNTYLASSALDATKDVVIAHATSSSNYIEPGSGVLTYLQIEKKSIYGQLTPTEAYKSFISTNGYTISKLSDTIPSIGVSAYSPMDSLYSASRNTSEIISFRKFGMRVSAHFLTTNEVLEEKSSSFVAQDPELSVDLFEKRIYDASFDSNEDGKIDLIDVQSAYHTLNPNSFGMSEDSIVPTVCCPCDTPEQFKLAIADFSTPGGELVLKADSGWGKDRTYSVARLGLGQNSEGGILLAWTQAENCEYYIVYRKSSAPGSRAIPIIGSKVGVIANSGNSFNYSVKKSSVRKVPVQIDSTVWVDFPPSNIRECCDWCEEEDSSCTGQEESKTSYEYYVVAHNDCGETRTNSMTGKIPCTNFPPKVKNRIYTMPGGASFMGAFDVSVKDSDSNFYTYVNFRSSDTTTEKGNRVVCKGGPPIDSFGRKGKANARSFKYIPKVGFFGRDSFRFYATVENYRAARWEDWCSDAGTIEFLVVPPPAKAKVVSGDCGSSEERGAAVINWGRVEGVTYYKIIRNGTLIAKVLPEERTRFIDTEIIEETQKNCNLPMLSYSYSVVPCYVDDDGQELFSQPAEMKVEIECCGEIENPEFFTRKDQDICRDEDKKPQNGVVTLLWKDLGDFNIYNIYKRYKKQTGSYSPWVFIGNYDQTELGVKGRNIEWTDYKIKPCVGCSTFEVEYAVTSVTVAGEGEINEIYSENQAVRFECCNSGPIASDQEVLIEGSKLLINKKLKAWDRDSDIVYYELLSEPVSDAGEIFNFDSEAGVFSFAPSLSFEGETNFEWYVQDSCGNTDIATFTLTLVNPGECNEDDYIICNASLSYLTEQQDNINSRARKDNVPQVPFSLNNKGVPSLRKRCGAYALTTSLNPSNFALSQDGCIYASDTIIRTYILPMVNMTCDDDVYFSECRDKKVDGIPATFISCENEISFADCKPFRIERLPEANVECEDNIAINDCTEEVIEKIGITSVVCDESKNGDDGD